MAANLKPGSVVRPTGSKLELIQATVAAISQHGLAALTSAKIAGAAGHTAASINFHFGSKEALLLATLREVSEEFSDAMARVMEEAGGDELRALLGIVDASLGRGLSGSDKIAVWYSFLAESKARGDYQRICGERDTAWNRMVIGLCRQLIAARGKDSPWPDAEAVAQGLMGLIDQQWQGILFEGDAFDREAARRQCRAYLCSVFPWFAPRIEATAAVRPRLAEPAALADPAIKLTLPGWIYHNEEFHDLEKERIFLSSWQIVGHQSEVPETGDYLTFEFFGRRGFIVRDRDGAIRAFHNVCAHRAHAVVSGERGRCAKHLTCMYHGWTYHLDGRNRSVSASETFPKFDRAQYGLKPIELENFMGFLFVRFRGGEPSVAERMAPHVDELSHYRLDRMVPLGKTWTQELPIDWKNVIENYVEDYHFPMGHPGLSALTEAEYDRESFPGGTMRLSHRLREQPLKSWSAERYAKFLPVVEHLPAELRRRWSYFGLYPNVFFDIYPEWMDFFHVLPLGAGRTLLRGRSFGFPDERREMKAARYLCTRLNRRVQAEDEQLTESVQRGLASGGYTQGILSSKEIVLAGFQDWVRERLPVAGQVEAPEKGMVAERNAALVAEIGR
ncbi:MAG: Rieske 2Fe-2S domain-containing protein [Gammaproteobacteria bacterium]|nr:Rieske 2Fe-2S domain-containing protein [Gammaproteobacteria bacterium]